jgi:hypothetical protein
MRSNSNSYLDDHQEIKLECWPEYWILQSSYVYMKNIHDKIENFDGKKKE